MAETIAYPDCAFPADCECRKQGYPNFEHTECVVPAINALAVKVGWQRPYPRPVITYVLDAAGEGVPEPDMDRWCVWQETADRHVGLDYLASGEIVVSTIFLGIDLNFSTFGCGAPVLWETRIIGGPHDRYEERYHSRSEALAGHERAKILAVTEP